MFVQVLPSASNISLVRIVHNGRMVAEIEASLVFGEIKVEVNACRHTHVFSGAVGELSEAGTLTTD